MVQDGARPQCPPWISTHTRTHTAHLSLAKAAQQLFAIRLIEWPVGGNKLSAKLWRLGVTRFCASTICLSPKPHKSRQELQKHKVFWIKFCFPTVMILTILKNDSQFNSFIYFRFLELNKCFFFSLAFEISIKQTWSLSSSHLYLYVLFKKTMF